MAKQHDCVVILDFGAINAQMVAKAVRQRNIYCEVLPYTTEVDRIVALKPKALILQRGKACGERTLGRELPAETAALNLPVLDMAVSSWEETEMRDFLVDTCGLSQDWTTEAFIDETVADLRVRIGDRKVLLAMSGGVDSSVCAALLHRAVGHQLTCVFVDHGCMRMDEPRQIEEVFRGQFGINLVSVNAEERFLKKLKGIRDPEKKRAIIGEEFIRVFEEEARKLGDLDYFVQGTIYPDIIESGWDGGKTVKAHHNVGGLPDRIDFKGILEPVKYLFKDEVRKVGEAMGIPHVVTRRQPFPGPGLAVRCLGELTLEKLEILRKADAIFRKSMDDRGYGTQASQYFAVLTNAQSVGVTDDARTYGYVIALRAVQTTDFMTAGVVPLPIDFLTEVAGRIAAEVKDVNRVVYDITSKPPATIEWE
ncbi:glutamine-hydrolyzing GMP synthase [Desulfobotulus sp. H1]|uniref:GMP synthase (glutamine-hydrolyzing) n=1 Tax=Desulfobotulus pelophilus TaxID=2823377 RepID=A0ABT3NA71_9BACT|nr:glutamine-hydrolyzing GMP synthase [Desulfobotulus pelophilus]MCW7754360.1 glutamine-hydrolyzing GMP synthase [Desulfobotulus pelophilus]